MSVTPRCIFLAFRKESHEEVRVYAVQPMFPAATFLIWDGEWKWAAAEKFTPMDTVRRAGK